jgi:hypothetical protein
MTSATTAGPDATPGPMSGGAYAVLARRSASDLAKCPQGGPAAVPLSLRQGRCLNRYCSARLRGWHEGAPGGSA